MGERLLSRKDRLDSSQARSAWEAMRRGPRPVGTVEVSPTDFVVETEPRMSKRQRVFMPFQKRQVKLCSCRKVWSASHYPIAYGR